MFPFSSAGVLIYMHGTESMHGIESVHALISLSLLKLCTIYVQHASEVILCPLTGPFPKYYYMNTY